MRTKTATFLALVVFGIALAAPPARAQTTAQIATDVVRTLPRPGAGVVQLWWLPVEYWIAASKEIGQSAEETDEVRKVYQDYILIAALDVSVDETGKPTGATIAEIVKRTEIRRNGETMKVLRQVNPAIANRTSQLAYPLKASLGVLGGVLRVLPVANLDATGHPILSGVTRGDLEIVYRPPEGGEPIEIRWNGPLTSIAGHSRCPEGGEALEAHWSFCPWHGVPAKGAPSAGR